MDEKEFNGLLQGSFRFNSISIYHHNIEDENILLIQFAEDL